MTAHRTIRQRPATRAARVVWWLTAGAITLAGLPAQAQPDPMRGLPIVRDAEIEQLLREYTRPILRAAGLANQTLHPVILSERTFNAFVVDGRRIFVNAGALTEAQTPNQIIGVLAHEIGHIAGGHLAKMRQEMANVQTAAIIAMLLGPGAGAAAARGPGSGDALAAAVLAPQSAALRSLLSYQRQQEEQADRAGVKFLAATGQSAKGMYETFKRFADQILFTSRYIDPYVQSHPMPKERRAAPPPH